MVKNSPLHHLGSINASVWQLGGLSKDIARHRSPLPKRVLQIWDLCGYGIHDSGPESEQGDNPAQESITQVKVASFLRFLTLLFFDLC